jgi:hypothetical protein
MFKGYLSTPTFSTILINVIASSKCVVVDQPTRMLAVHTIWYTMRRVQLFYTPFLKLNGLEIGNDVEVIR